MNLKEASPERFGAIASFFYRRWAEPSLLPLYRRVGAEVPIEEGRLLDIGCGPGRLARLLAAANPALEVVGLDASPAMLREARRGPVLPNLEFREGSVEEADFEPEFDFALSVLSFHHWEEPRRGLEAVHRLLAPGGVFWIYEPDAEASDEEIRLDRAPLWGWLRIPPSLERLMARTHGFSEKEIEETVRPVVGATPFGDCESRRRGSTWRIALQKA
ncbi:MAG: class I SAM-dependent methyltransferase [Thermoanaerobaculia bacterium]